MTQKDYVIKLKDGRKLGYAEYGASHGKPLIFFHGWPSSRLHAKYLDHVAKKLKIRIIAPDRSGFGLSDYQSIKSNLVGYPFFSKLGWANYHKIPFLAEWAAFYLRLETKFLPVPLYSFFMAKEDRRLQKNVYNDPFRKEMEESFRQGTKAAAQDLKIYSGSWGV